MEPALNLGEFATSLSAQADALQSGDVTAGLRAVIIAARDPELQRTLFRHVARGERFIGATPYAQEPSDGDRAQLVVFSFDASPSGAEASAAVAAYVDTVGGRLSSVADGVPLDVSATRTEIPVAGAFLFAIRPPPKDPTNTGNATWSGREGRQTQDDFADAD